jgi:phenylpyruvate tautomerase PptA (4-oxalocrotonate tautomerase family)
MPVIRITSLPFASDPDIPASIRGVSATLATLFDIDEQHITITWDFLQPGHYSSGGETADYQSPNSHPLIVKILVPDFNPPENIEKILLSVAEVLAKSVKVSQGNIFIHLETAHSGSVFDDGIIARWPAAREDNQMTDQPKRSGEDRRDDEDRRSANDPNASPEERRSGMERRSGEDRRKDEE